MKTPVCSIQDGILHIARYGMTPAQRLKFQNSRIASAYARMTGLHLVSQREFRLLYA